MRNHHSGGRDRSPRVSPRGWAQGAGLGDGSRGRGFRNLSHFLPPLGPAPFLLFTLMVTPRKQQTMGSVARFSNGESDEIRKEKVIVYICFERFFYLFKETLKRVSLLWDSDI